MGLRVSIIEGAARCNCDEREALRELVDQFASAVLAKLETKLDEGYSGWNEPSEFPVDKIKKCLLEHVEFGDPVDIAAFAAFWWNRLPENKAAEAAKEE